VVRIGKPGSASATTALLMAEHGIGQPVQIRAAIETSAIDPGEPTLIRSTVRFASA
jgi:hypothetical protein